MPRGKKNSRENNNNNNMSSKSKPKASDEELKDILDSDDELPDFYYESPDMPAYQDHSRFETIQFQWMEEKLQQLKINETDQVTKKQETEEIKRELSTSIFLSKSDIYIIKSIEQFSTDSTLLWFIDFLKSKSIDKYNPRMSCLIQKL